MITETNESMIDDLSSKESFVLAFCKEFIDNTQALGLKMGSALLADNKSRNCKRGDYVELDSEPTFKTSPDADIGNINRAIKEHWENLGL